MPIKKKKQREEKRGPAPVVEEAPPPLKETIDPRIDPSHLRAVLPPLGLKETMGAAGRPVAQLLHRYFMDRVAPVLEDLSMAVLEKQGEEPVPIMLRWLAEDLKRRGVAEEKAMEEASLREEADKLREEVRVLEERRASQMRAMVPVLGEADSKVVPPNMEDSPDDGSHMSEGHHVPVVHHLHDTAGVHKASHSPDSAAAEQEAAEHDFGAEEPAAAQQEDAPEASDAPDDDAEEEYEDDVEPEAAAVGDDVEEQYDDDAEPQADVEADAEEEQEAIKLLAEAPEAEAEDPKKGDDSSLKLVADAAEEDMYPSGEERDWSLEMKMKAVSSFHRSGGHFFDADEALDRADDEEIDDDDFLEGSGKGSGDGSSMGGAAAAALECVATSAMFETASKAIAQTDAAPTSQPLVEVELLAGAGGRRRFGDSREVSSAGSEDVGGFSRFGIKDEAELMARARGRRRIGDSGESSPAVSEDVVGSNRFGGKRETNPRMSEAAAAPSNSMPSGLLPPPMPGRLEVDLVAPKRPGRRGSLDASPDHFGRHEPSSVASEAASIVSTPPASATAPSATSGRMEVDLVAPRRPGRRMGASRDPSPGFG